MFRRQWRAPPARRSFVLSAGAVVSGTIVISTPVAGRIHQRSGTTGTITVTGTYTGTPTTIEARVVQDGTNTVVSAFDWATVVASPAGGTYSFSIAAVPQGGWYNVQVRFSNDTAVNAASDKVGVGVLYALCGQSNAYYWVRSRATSTDPNSLIRVYGNIGTWQAPNKTAMAGAIWFGNAMVSSLSVPVGVLDYGDDNASLYADWLPVSGTMNRNFTNAVGALDDKLEAVVWIQGEADAAAAQSQVTYYANLGTLFADWRTQFSQAALPIIMVTLGRTTGDDTYATDAEWHAIFLAQLQKCADTAIYRCDRKDLPLLDTVHPTAAGFETLGARVANVAKYILSGSTYYEGPQLADVRQASGTEFDVILTHNGGTDITPSSAITGFRVLDGGTPITVSTAVRRAANKIRLTLASAPSGFPTVQYLYGKNPTVTGVVFDNSGTVLPLESNDGVVAQAALTASITLVDTSGAARASLSSLKWAWFDNTTPASLIAPTDQGSAETTDGGGVLTVSLPNTLKSSGGVGFLVVSDTDGTTTQSPAHKSFAGPVAIS